MHVEDKSPSTKAAGETLLKHISNTEVVTQALPLLPHTHSPLEEQMLPVVSVPQAELAPQRHLPLSGPAAVMQVGSQDGHDDESTHPAHWGVPIVVSHVGIAPEHALRDPHLHELDPNVGTSHLFDSVGLQISFVSVSLEH